MLGNNENYIIFAEIDSTEGDLSRYFKRIMLFNTKTLTLEKQINLEAKTFRYASNFAPQAYFVNELILFEAFSNNTEIADSIFSVNTSNEVHLFEPKAYGLYVDDNNQVYFIKTDNPLEILKCELSTCDVSKEVYFQSNVNIVSYQLHPRGVIVNAQEGMHLNNESIHVSKGARIVSNAHLITSSSDMSPDFYIYDLDNNAQKIFRIERSWLGTVTTVDEHLVFMYLDYILGPECIRIVALS